MESDRESSIADKVDELRQEFLCHPGRIACARRDELNRSIQVFFRNATELLTLLDDAENNIDIGVELIQNVRSSHFRENYGAMLDQRMHNMLASAVTLVDHTRRWLSNYVDTEFERSFNERSDAIKESPVAAFLRRLRNYLLHYGMAPFEYQLSIAANKAERSYILLSSTELLKWDDWNAAARSYIEDSGESIQLSVPVKTYHSQMEALYRWVSEQFNIMHTKEIADANRIVDEINILIYGSPTGPPN